MDDDADLRLTVSSALSENHYLVDQARDGEEGVNSVRAGHFDLVLLDVNMPRMTGMEALKEIKAHDPSIIVIMLTAFSNVRDAVEATRKALTTTSRSRSRPRTSSIWSTRRSRPSTW